MKPRAVLFDFYNTLLNIHTEEHHPDVWIHLARYLSYQGLRIDAEALHAAFSGKMRLMQRESGEEYPEINMVKLFQAVLAELGYTGPEQFCIQVTQLFRMLSMRRFEAFPDSLPALQALRGSLMLGLISDAQRIFLEPEMEQVGMDGFFDVRIISSDYGFRKPDPRLFTMALDALGLSAGETVYVGDNAFRDVCGARSAGIPGLLLTRHKEFQEEADRRCRPDLIFRGLDELLDWLKSSGGEERMSDA